VDALLLIDHHCHSLVTRDLDRDSFEGLLNEGSTPGPLGGSYFDSLLGLAVRRWCAPVLDLPAHAPPEDYLDRRAGLGAAEVNRRFLRAAELAALYVDTGITAEPLLDLQALGAAAGAETAEVVRLEQVADEVDGTAAGFAQAFRERLAVRARNAIGVKSIAAYRHGLALGARPPSRVEVTAAAGRWMASGTTLADETLHRFLIWSAVDLGLPIQFHVGYGDQDLDLDQVNPLLLTHLLRAIEPTGVPVMLLHNYPFHREAAYLAQVFSNVFMDVGLAVHNTGRRAKNVLAEAMELVPFGKLLFSSDAYGLAELYYLGALLFRRALTELLAEGVADGDLTDADAARIAALVGAGNARRVYGRDAATAR
jgi:uncharacterized protein